MKLVRLFEKGPSVEDGPSKDIKMKDLSNILNMRIFESDFMKKLYLREKSLSADVLSHRPLGLEG